MSQKSGSRIQERLKNKSLLWYAGIIFIVLGIIGIAYGVFIVYNGVRLRDFESDALKEALAVRGMSKRDGMYALIGFGSIIAIVYLFMLGAGVLGVLSSGRILTSRTLFWYAIVISSILVLLGLSRILEWGLASTGIAASLFYGFSVYKKFNKDLKFLESRAKK